MAPLDGIRVLDFSHHVAGPVCTMILGDLGAEVFKVEPTSGEASRSGGTFTVGGEDGLRTSFIANNRNKKSIAIDLKADDGRDIALNLAKRCDVVVSNFRPGTMARLGLDYEYLRELNRRLIYCGISAFGDSGPYQNKHGLDIVLQAMGGLMSLTGDERGGGPVPAGAPVADFVSGVFGALGVLAALQERHVTGLGQRVKLSMLDTVASMLGVRFQQYFATKEDIPPLGSGHPQACPWQTFMAQDAPFVLAVNTDEFWQKLCRAIERPDLAKDPRFLTNAGRVANQDTLVPELDRWFRQRPRRHWTERLDDEGVPAGPIYRLSDVVSDPQAQVNGTFAELQTDIGRIPTVSLPVSFSASPDVPLNAPPSLGEHTDATLISIGYSSDDVAGLRRRGVVG